MKSFRIIKFKKKPFFLVKKLSKSFSKSNLVLNQINFHVNKGEIFGILGPNGSGKTTIFNLILGLLAPDEGKISIIGEPINTYPIHERCTKWKISFVPQNSACFLGLSVEQNLTSVGEIKIKDKIKRKERVQELLVKFNLENKKNTFRKVTLLGTTRRSPFIFSGAKSRFFGKSLFFVASFGKIVFFRSDFHENQSFFW